MKAEIWQTLSRVNDYLEERKNAGVEAFKDIFTKAKTESAALVVFSFTYENVEAYAKVNGQFALYQAFFGVLSQGELDELTSFDYDDANTFEDYQYWKFQSLVWELIEMWLVDCFETASKATEAPAIKYYYKHNHDSLEALELNTCDRKFEKSEFEVYVKNNQQNLLELLG